MAWRPRKQDKIAIFKTLAEKPLYEAGLDHQLDKILGDDKQKIKNRVYRIYNEVKNAPEKFQINQETVDLVVNVVSNRSTIPQSSNILPSNTLNGELRSGDINDLVLNSRDKLATLIDKKLDLIGSSKKKLEAESLTSLTKAFSMIFDKGQIIQGKATEHIGMVAKIDENINPDEALKMLIEGRNKMLERKYD